MFLNKQPCTAGPQDSTRQVRSAGDGNGVVWPTSIYSPGSAADAQGGDPRPFYLFTKTGGGLMVSKRAGSSAALE